jgi:hypothetical protein
MTPPLSGARRAAAVVGAGVLALAVLMSFVPGGGAEGASPSSSYSTRPAGLAAYAELLERFGHPVTQLRGELAPADLDPGGTVVVLDAPGLSTEEAERLGRFVQAGGRLVAGGLGAEEWLEPVVEEGPTASDEGSPTARPVGNAPEVDGVGTVRSAGLASWDDPGTLDPVLGGDGGAALALVGSPGRGRLVALADPSPLQNRLLGTADNAAFGLAVAGEAGRPVRFAEGPHGYGRGEGLSALPRRWRLALAGLGLAGGIWLVARSRRLGPPEEEARPLPPPRRTYVEALAGTLARTGRPFEATEPVRARARHLAAERAGLPPEAGEAALREAGTRLGLPADEVEALAGPGDEGEDGILAAGRALARLSQGPTTERGTP